MSTYPVIDLEWTKNYRWYNVNQQIENKSYYVLISKNNYLSDSIASSFGIWPNKTDKYFIGVLPGSKNPLNKSYDSVIGSYSGIDDLRIDDYSHNHILCSPANFLKLFKILNIKRN